MKDLIIAGAGGFGREALALAKTLNKIEPQWNIRGFINDIPDALDGVKCTHSIIGTIKDWQPSENEVFVMGISSPVGKEKVAGILKAKGAKFITLIHPAALISDEAILGEGCIIGGRSSIGGGTEVGNFVHIAGSMIGQDAVIGDYSTTTGFANITNAKLYLDCTMKPTTIMEMTMGTMPEKVLTLGRTMKDAEKLLDETTKKLAKNAEKRYAIRAINQLLRNGEYSMKQMLKAIKKVSDSDKLKFEAATSEGKESEMTHILTKILEKIKQDEIKKLEEQKEAA